MKSIINLMNPVLIQPVPSQPYKHDALMRHNRAASCRSCAWKPF